MKASATVEMSYMMPIIFMIFVFFVYSVFYFFDKNILYGTVFETEIIGMQNQRVEDELDTERLENFVKEQADKMIFMELHNIEIGSQNGVLYVEVEARKKWMKIHIKREWIAEKEESSLRKKKHRKEVIDGIKSEARD